MGRSFWTPIYIIVLLIFGSICYFVADMFVKKSFKVFYKTNWIKCGLFSVILLVSFGGLSAYSVYCRNYIPSEDRIVSASVSKYYSCEFEGEELNRVINIHTMILENLEEIEVSNDAGNYETISIRYEMKSGNKITRRYRIALDGIGSEIRRNVYEMEMDADNFLRYRISKYYKEVEEFIAGGLSFSVSETYANSSGLEGEYYAGKYTYETLTPEQCKKLYEAVILDAKAGKLQLYNGVYYYDYVGDNVEQEVDKVSYYADVHFTYVVPKAELENIQETVMPDKGGYTIEESNYTGATTNRHRECYFSFGPGCTNILNALVECGIIESIDQIRWYY